MEKLYREHRGGFKESIETTISIPNKEFLEDHIKNIYELLFEPYDKILIGEPSIDKRLPPEWGDTQYMVYIQKKSGSKYPIGYTNFSNF